LGHNSTRTARERQSLVRLPGRAYAPGETVRLDCLELPQVRQTNSVVGNRPAGRWGLQHGINEHGVAIGLTSIRTRLRAEGPTLTGTDLVRLALERAATARQALDWITTQTVRLGQSAVPIAGPVGVQAGETVAYPSRGLTGGVAATFPAAPVEGEGLNSAFLIADAREAYAVETCGRHWAVQEVREVRAMSDACQVRQDWDGISPGLADFAIGKGWWPADGSKLDFAEAFGATGGEEGPGLRRWGRATLLLEQQNSHIDVGYVRRILGDHFEGCADEVDPADGSMSPAWELWSESWDWSPDASPEENEEAGQPIPLCRHAANPSSQGTVASLVAQVGPNGRVPLAWCAFGPPCTSVYFPIAPAGELPSAFSCGVGDASESVWGRMMRLQTIARLERESRAAVRQALANLQQGFDQRAEEFRNDTAALVGPKDREELHRLATSFMQQNLERFDECWTELMERDWAAGRVQVSLR
jgi:dipeptidase